MATRTDLDEALERYHQTALRVRDEARAEGAAEEAARIRRELLEVDWPVILGVNRWSHERRLREILDRIVPEEP